MKIKQIIIAILIVFGLFFLREGCQNAKIAKLETENSLLQVKNQEYRKEINTLGDSIVKQIVTIVENEKQLRTFTDSIFKLKKKVKAVEFFYKENTRLKWDTVFIPYKDVPDDMPVYDPFNVDTAKIRLYVENSISVPRKFDTTSTYFSLSGTVLKNGVIIDSPNIPDTFSLRVVDTKGGLLKKSIKEVQSFHTNPLIQSFGVQSIKIEEPKKPFIKTLIDKLFWVGVGIFIKSKI